MRNSITDEDFIKMNKEDLKKTNLYAPINPFTNDKSPIKLNLILTVSDDYGYFLYNKHCKLQLHYHPFPEYFHVSDLKFYELKNIKEIHNYCSCLTHNKLYTKFCHKAIFCDACETLDFNEIKYFKDIELNWAQFEKNKNKVIKIILKLILEFYPDKLKEFKEDEFCKIETEKIIFEKVNKLLNTNEYDELLNKKLRLLILDFNSFIISALKIFNTNKFYSENYLYNMNLFEDIDFPEIFNFNEEKPDINCQSLDKFLIEETLKENICYSLRNFNDFEQFLKKKKEKNIQF